MLSSIAAVVLGGSSLSGGTASVGAVCGAVLFTSLINGFAILGISRYYRPVAVGTVLSRAAAIARFRK
ncbi:hypothetical protein ACW2Q0_05100 [Nocardia sp. R16R-3T]